MGVALPCLNPVPVPVADLEADDMILKIELVLRGTVYSLDPQTLQKLVRRLGRMATLNVWLRSRWLMMRGGSYSTRTMP
jgi:hypothetical protein